MLERDNGRLQSPLSGCQECMTIMIQIYSGDTGYALRDLSGTEGVTYFNQPALLYTEKTRKDPTRPEKTRKDPTRPEKTRKDALIYTEKTRKDALIYSEKTRKDPKRPKKTRKDVRKDPKRPEKTRKDPKRRPKRPKKTRKDIFIVDVSGWKMTRIMLLYNK